MSQCVECDCDNCVREREVQRLVRVLNSWPAGGVVKRHSPKVKERITFKSILPPNLRFA